MNSTLILSDTHIGEVFAQKRCQALIELVQQYQRIILNGDFLDDMWDYSRTTQSQWKPFFETLKNTYVIYLFGNHDRDTESLRAATAGFVDEYADEYCISVGEKELVVMHGHTIYPRPDGILYQEKKTWFGRFFQVIARNVWYGVYRIVLWVRLHIERSSLLRRWQRPIIIRQNNRMKKYAQQHLEPHQILICGHSHLSEDARDEQFINIGANCYDRLEYLEVKDTALNLVTQTLTF